MPSFASAPELQKNTLSAKVASTSRCARRSACGTRYRLETCITLRRLLGDGGDQVRVAVAERGGGDAGAEIEESSPVRRIQPGALAPLESEVGAVVGRHQGGDHNPSSCPR